MIVMTITLVVPDDEVEGAEKVVQEDVFQHYACFAWDSAPALPEHIEWYESEYQGDDGA
jgi:hypothetical protein